MVEGAALEMLCGETHPGFESLTLRQKIPFVHSDGIFIFSEQRNFIMEFNEKLQELRKSKQLTQEELAERLFVSRTAISKWESGRGYPNIDSLKAISEFFDVTVDDLLSGDKLLDIAAENSKEKENHIRDLVFGLLDCCTALLLFLPFFGQEVDGNVNAVTLFQLTDSALYLRLIYLALIAVTVVCGISILALQNYKQQWWIVIKNKFSIVLSVAGVFLFIVSSAPYAATYLFVFLLIKNFIIIKWH